MEDKLLYSTQMEPYRGKTDTKWNLKTASLTPYLGENFILQAFLQEISANADLPLTKMTRSSYLHLR